MDRVTAALTPSKNPRSDPRCSFCGKARSQVVDMVAGPSEGEPTAFICDQCIALCNEIVTARRSDKT